MRGRKSKPPEAIRGEARATTSLNQLLTSDPPMVKLAIGSIGSPESLLSKHQLLSFGKRLQMGPRMRKGDEK
jgi:hypothetical protein